MRTLNKASYFTKQFNDYVASFSASLNLINPTKSIIVAVSGGVDSIALMYVLDKISPKKIKVLHINHGTRPENIDEENLVLKHCNLLGLELDIVKFNLELGQNNFEAIARNLRAQVFKQYIQKNYWVYTAHHLDDSFEWSMIQSFKQSSLTSTLGIPVFNRGMVRPFMCVSKNQIRRYARTLELSWAEDSSNLNIRFERNFFRQALTGRIEDRYPQYLRHYVARQNELALKLSLHRNLHKKDKKLTQTKIIEKRESSGSVVLKSLDFLFHKDLIKEWIHFFSKTHRGEIDRELDKLIIAHKKITMDAKEIKIKGPLHFSGGVNIFILDNYLLITNDLHLEFYKRLDDKLALFLKSPNALAQITGGIASKSLTKKVVFPYLTFIDSQYAQFSSKLIHPLLPKSCQLLKEQKIAYSFYPLLERKLRDLPKISKEKINLSAVILDSSILGL